MKTSFPLKMPGLLGAGVLAGIVAITNTGCTASAFGPPSLAIEVQSAVSSGSVSVRLVDGTAILSGRVKSFYDALAAERVASRYEGVDRVINHIYVNR